MNSVELDEIVQDHWCDVAEYLPGIGRDVIIIGFKDDGFETRLDRRPLAAELRKIDKGGPIFETEDTKYRATHWTLPPAKKISDC